MANKHPKWTPTEDSEVVKAVKNSPACLKQAFEKASKATGRTPLACSNRWYTVLSKDKANACFITVSSKHQTLNRKNGQGTPCNNSLFTRILKLLKIIK